MFQFRRTVELIGFILGISAISFCLPYSGQCVDYEFHHHGNLSTNTWETDCGSNGYRYGLVTLDESGVQSFKLTRGKCDSGSKPEVLVTRIHSKTIAPYNLFITKASNGLRYGVFRPGAAGADGYIFTYRPDGSTNLLWSFGSELPFNGYGPNSALVEHTNGFLYGTTFFAGPSSGASGGGVIYRIRLDGSGYSVVAAFHESGTAGVNPFGPIFIGSDGFIYGTAGGGPRQARGVIFRVHPDRPNSRFDVGGSWVVKSFTGEFASPQLSFEGADGALYGYVLVYSKETETVLGYMPFRISKTGQDFQLLSKDFSINVNGLKALAEGSDGSIYGVNLDSEGFPNGSVFEWRPKKEVLRFSRGRESTTFAWTIAVPENPRLRLEEVDLPEPFLAEWFQVSTMNLSNSTRVVTFPHSTSLSKGRLFRLVE